MGNPPTDPSARAEVNRPTDRHGLLLCGVRGTPEQYERHRKQEQAEYNRQLARYLQKGSYL